MFLCLSVIQLILWEMFVLELKCFPGTTFVGRFAATCARSSGRVARRCAVGEKNKSRWYPLQRERGLNGVGVVAREEAGLALVMRQPLPAFSTATAKTKIASCVTNEPTLTYPPDLWQSVLPPSCGTRVAKDGPESAAVQLLSGHFPVWIVAVISLIPHYKH